MKTVKWPQWQSQLVPISTFLITSNITDQCEHHPWTEKYITHEMHATYWPIWISLMECILYNDQFVHLWNVYYIPTNLNITHEMHVKYRLKWISPMECMLRTDQFEYRHGKHATYRKILRSPMKYMLYWTTSMSPMKYMLYWTTSMSPMKWPIPWEVVLSIKI